MTKDETIKKLEEAFKLMKSSKVPAPTKWGVNKQYFASFGIRVYKAFSKKEWADVFKKNPTIDVIFCDFDSKKNWLLNENGEPDEL